jgi:tetratricopeptide (TPR) repeat protein
MMSENRDREDQLRHEHALQQHALEQHEVKQVLKFLREYGRAIVFGAAAVVIVYMGTVFMRNRHAEAEALASAKLLQANSGEAFQQIADEYASTTSAPAALLARARIAFNTGEYETAAAVYNRFLTDYPEHDAAWIAELGQAACLEARQQTEPALSEYQRLAREYADHMAAPMALTGQIRCLEKLDRLQEAVQTCEAVILKDPQSTWALKAEAVKIRLERQLDG